MCLGFDSTPTSLFTSDRNLHKMLVLFHHIVTFRSYLIYRISHTMRNVSPTKEGIIYFVCLSAPILNSAISNSGINTGVTLKLFI